MRREAGDAICIKELELSVHIGVTDEERTHPQRLTASITVWPTGGFTGLDDRLANAVDYAVVCEEIKEFVKRRRDKLIETLADVTAAHLLATFPLLRVQIELRKFILSDVKHVAVILSRDAPAGVE